MGKTYLPCARKLSHVARIFAYDKSGCCNPCRFLPLSGEDGKRTDCRYDEFRCTIEFAVDWCRQLHYQEPWLTSLSQRWGRIDVSELSPSFLLHFSLRWPLLLTSTTGLSNELQVFVKHSNFLCHSNGMFTNSISLEARASTRDVILVHTAFNPTMLGSS